MAYGLHTKKQLKCEAIIKEAQGFIRERFPFAALVRWSYFSYIIVREIPHQLSHHDFYHMPLQGITPDAVSSFEYLGRYRFFEHSAWNSAKLEIQKYEAGKKESPFMDRIRN